jgi:hypothetical protein
METICSSEKSVDFQRTTRLYIPEDSTFHNHRYENLKSYRVIHKSVKHFENLHSSQILNMSTLADTADIYAIIHFVPHPCQHITSDQSHSSGNTVAKTLEIATIRAGF